MTDSPLENKRLRFFFVIFTASGFAGLIYESIWTHYLKLFLGHAAYAQALVLAVFMGGMALGALLCSRYSERMGNLLLGYAIAEVIIGVFAILFHPAYVRFIDFAYAAVIPALGSPLAVASFKWSAAILLILPQSILLGMTFPLMTAGLLRKFPQAPGTLIAMLYFTNSIGAAVGVLASGFLFIGLAGLPGTLVIAGFINIIVAAAVWLEDKRMPATPALPTAAASVSAPDTPRSAIFTVFLLIAFLTGLSSFIYEIGWIRMLSLVLGSSTHAFEIMLSAFILGIALGGFWIKRRIDTFDDPRRFLALVQVAMGLFALATLPLYGRTFNVMAWLIRTLPHTETGYLLFNLSSHGISLVIMLPAAFCAGMTLPLITTALLRTGSGERSIGAVYGFNTIGSIIGVVIAIHLAMPLLGLKGMITLGAGIDIVLGLGIAWWAYPDRRFPLVYTAVSALALILSSSLVNFDPNKMSSGVYRFGQFNSEKGEETVYHRDGKTATISIVKNNNNFYSIRTNGKPDAGIQVGGTGHSLDEETMALAGAIGSILRPDAETAAVIGWGSGMTTHTLMTVPTLRSVDTIEIEPVIIQAARHFGDRVHLAYDDPRSHYYIEDAKSYFSFHRRKYDLIISEPSNPWVSGVASLFTGEFYYRVRDYLNPNGLFVQWIQLYEINLPLIASIMNALAPHFSDYAIYAVNRTDMLIVASLSGTVPKPDGSYLSMGGLTAELQRIGIRTRSDIDVRLMGNKGMFAPLFASYDITRNSDYTPVVDLYAVKSRFLHARASDQLLGADLHRLPLIDLLGGQALDLRPQQLTFSTFPRSQNFHGIQAVYQYLLSGRWQWDPRKDPIHAEIVRSTILARRILTAECSEEFLHEEWWGSMFYIAANVLPSVPREQQPALFRTIASPACQQRFTESQRNFVLLLQSIGERNAQRMAAHARVVLEKWSERSADANLIEYILDAGMLGSIASGRREEARLLWKTYGRLLPVQHVRSLTHRLLLAQLSDQEVN